MTLTYYIKGFQVLISEEDKALFESHTWYLVKARQLTEKYYAATFINGKTVYLHRLIINAIRGEVVDHENRNTLDCTRDNLRIVTQSINRHNSEVRANKKSSNLKGVFYKPNRTKPYYSMIQQQGQKAIWVGSFATEQEAYNAYLQKLKELNIAA